MPPTDRVVVLGRDACVWSVGGTPVEVWDVDEPSHPIGGIARMRLIRDGISGRIDGLVSQLRV